MPSPKEARAVHTMELADIDYAEIEKRVWAQYEEIVTVSFNYRETSRKFREAADRFRQELDKAMAVITKVAISEALSKIASPQPVTTTFSVEDRERMLRLVPRPKTSLRCLMSNQTKDPTWNSTLT